MAKRGYKPQEFTAHASDVKCLNIGKKSCRVFVTGGEDCKVNLWAIDRPTSLLSLSGHTSPVESVTFDSAEGLVLAGASSGTTKLWDLEEAKIVRTLSGHRSKCTSLEFHPFGEFFASGSLDADLKIWDIRRKGCIHTYKGHTRGIRTIRFTPDGRWVVSGGDDNVVKLWDLTAGKLLHEFKFHSGVIRSIDFHPHEFLLATGSADRTVKFWDLETFELIGSAGPEDSGVRSMVFHPDGKTLFCGLDETLKVFSWEPVRCHDDVDIGWSMLGDLSIYEGKLLGCSYHQSSVGVWVVDISHIGPYAGDSMPRLNSSMETIFKPGDDHTVKQTDNSLKSFGIGLNGSRDQGDDVKEIIHTECVTSNDICQKSYGKVGSTKASKVNPRSSTLLKGSKGTLSCQGTLFEKKSASRAPTSNMSSLRDSRITENGPGTLKRSGSNSMSKGIHLNSTGFSRSASLNSKKDSMMEVCTGTDIQVNRTVCSPLVVPRDSPDLRSSAKFRKETSTPETDSHDKILHKTAHSRRPSYVDGGTESAFSATEPEFSSSAANVSDGVVDSSFLHGFVANEGITDSDEGNQASIGPAVEKFERVIFLDRSFSSCKEKAAESNSSESHSGSEINSVKYVKGVAVQHGRTRSLVESWERRERFSNSCTEEVSHSLDVKPETDNISSNQNGQSFGRRDLTSEDDVPILSLKKSEDDGFPEVLLQNRDLFINVLKSRLTKLQMVRHCWEQNGIKGTINAVAKLPDYSVQVDVISILLEKVDLFTLDLFSCLLPLLVGLLTSKTERHSDISMEMLLKLLRIFGPVIRSTVSASSLVGVDIQAEQRLDRCRRCSILLEKIKEMLPSRIRKGGSLARRFMELNLALQE